MHVTTQLRVIPTLFGSWHQQCTHTQARTCTLSVTQELAEACDKGDEASDQDNVTLESLELYNCATAVIDAPHALDCYAWATVIGRLWSTDMPVLSGPSTIPVSFPPLLKAVMTEAMSLSAETTAATLMQHAFFNE